MSRQPRKRGKAQAAGTHNIGAYVTIRRETERSGTASVSVPIAPGVSLQSSRILCEA